LARTIRQGSAAGVHGARGKARQTKGGAARTGDRGRAQTPRRAANPVVSRRLRNQVGRRDGFPFRPEVGKGNRRSRKGGGAASSSGQSLSTRQRHEFSIQAAPERVHPLGAGSAELRSNSAEPASFYMMNARSLLSSRESQAPASDEGSTRSDLPRRRR